MQIKNKAKNKAKNETKKETRQKTKEKRNGNSVRKTQAYYNLKG